MLTTISTQPSMDLESLRKFVHSQVLPAANKPNPIEHFPLALYEELHKMGWMQAAVPEAYGGIGASTTDLACIARELAYGSSGVMMSTIVNGLGITAINLYAQEPLKKQLLTAYVDHFSLWSFCMTESNAGTDVAGIGTKAVRVAGGYLLSGHKCFITNSSFSEHLVVFARVTDMNHTGESNNAISAFYVPAGSNGISRGKPLEKLGQRDSNTGELFFDEVFVSDSNLLGTVGQGLKIMHHCIQRSKTMVAAGAIGICDRAHVLVTEHLGSRVRYGKPLLELSTIQNLLSQLQTEAQAGWLLVCLAAATWDSGEFAVREASMAKLWNSNLAVSYTNEALELFGAYGYSREYEIERLYRDSKALEILEGSTFIQLALISKELFARRAKLKLAA